MKKFLTLTSALSVLLLSSGVYAQTPPASSDFYLPASHNGKLPTAYAKPVADVRPETSSVSPVVSPMTPAPRPIEISTPTPQPVVPPPVGSQPIQNPVVGQQTVAPVPATAPANAVKSGPTLDELLNTEAFNQVKRSLLPANPDQINDFRQELDRTKQAVAGTDNGKTPHAVTRSVSLTLRPGEAAPMLRLFPGNATTLTFADSAGTSWPVQSVTVGNPTAYKAVEAGETNKTNMVVISPLQSYTKATNLVVTLLNHPVPIIFNMVTGTGDVDFRVDIGVKGRSPNTTTDSMTSSTPISATNDAVVQSFLDGTPPRGARKLKTSNRDVDAWTLNDVIYVRTQMELLSPLYVARSNISGIKVYTLIDQAPVLYLSQDGQQSFVTLEDKGAR